MSHAHGLWRRLVARAGRGAQGDAEPETSDLVDEVWYAGTYVDVGDAIAAGRFGSGYEHWRAIGRAEGRAPCALPVAAAWYGERYPDARHGLAAGRWRDALHHYVTVGAIEGRDPLPAFAERWYLERYPDVAAAVASQGWISGYHHFIRCGQNEGYRPHPDYDETVYRRRHPDVDRRVRAGELTSGFLHLASDGLSEGRPWRRHREGDVWRAARQLAGLRLERFLAAGERLRLRPAGRPAVSVVLVLHGRAELTLRCLRSLAATRGTELELVIVDNASTDATRALLERLDGPRVLLNEDNLGFTRAANQGAAAARGEVLLFLNNDAEVWPDSVQTALARLRGARRAGAVGGRVVGLDGRLQDAGSIVWRDGATEGYGRGDDPAAGAYLYPREVDYCSGVFLLTRRDLFARLGGFDESFAPAYYEEVDYCFRLRREGLLTLYEPGAVVVHYQSASLPDDVHVSQLLARHRPLFRERHAEALASAPRAGTVPTFLAADRTRYRGRLLVLDDPPPDPTLGGGVPRMAAILTALGELGYFVTYFVADPRPRDPRRPPPPQVAGREIVGGVGRERFAELWEARRGIYDALVVSRSSNLRWLVGEELDLGAPLIYDAEALAGERVLALAELAGESGAADGPEGQEGAPELAEELRLAAGADRIWAVSPGDAARLAGEDENTDRAHPHKGIADRVHIVGHGVAAEPGGPSFEARRGLLFVGRLVEAWNPNVDGLAWFFDAVLPELRRRLGQEVPMTVVGAMGDGVELPRPPGVRFVGRVDVLGPVYDRHRLFVAPSRAAAGIPLKVLEAAAHGLPVVASARLGEQLGWPAEALTTAAEAHGLATAVADLYGDAERWRRQRLAAIERCAAEHSPAVLRGALAAALTGIGVEDPT